MNNSWKNLWFVLGIIMISQPSKSEEMTWMSLPAIKSGKFISVSCQGVGPDKDVAIQVATNQCRSIAADHINGSFNIKTLSLETEQSVGFHSEVTTNYRVNGLFCDVQNQSCKEEDSFTCWLRCKFDVSLAKIVPIMEPERKPASEVELTNNAGHTIDFPAEYVKAGLNIHSKNKQIIITSIPKCQNIIVRGKMNTIFKCDSNPKTIVIYPDDYEIVVRAKGFIPKAIKLEKDRLYDGQPEMVEVILEVL